MCMYLESWRYCSPRFLQVRPSSQTRSPHTSHPCTLQGSTVHFFSVHTTHVMIQHLCTELLTPFTPAASALGRGREEGRPGPGERGPAALPAATGNEGGTEGRRQEAASGAALRAAPGAEAGGGGPRPGSGTAYSTPAAPLHSAAAPTRGRAREESPGVRPASSPRGRTFLRLRGHSAPPPLGAGVPPGLRDTLNPV